MKFKENKKNKYTYIIKITLSITIIAELKMDLSLTIYIIYVQIKSSYISFIYFPRAYGCKINFQNLICINTDITRKPFPYSIVYRTLKHKIIFIFYSSTAQLTLTIF